tara:strand:+ start:333 stop:1259 length:927 start_codon:yes stop_codon:yes gene_type:complete
MKKLILLLLFIPLISFGQTNIIDVDYVINNDNSVSFNYKKNVVGSYLVILEFSNLSNTRAQRRVSKILKNNSGSLFLKLKPINDENSIGFQYRTMYFKGSVNSKVNEDYPYILPFNKGDKITPRDLYSIENRYLNEEVPEGWKSYSFTFNEKKEVKAIRKGIVIEIKDTYTPDYSIEASFYSEQNSISIEHIDGTVATYKGFDKNTIQLKEGETVYPQTTLGQLVKYDKRDIYRLYLTLYSYTTKDNISLFSLSSSDDYGITYLTPKFYVRNSQEILKDNIPYIVDFDEKTQFKEMRKKEIKKFKINK